MSEPDSFSGTDSFTEDIHDADAGQHLHVESLQEREVAIEADAAKDPFLNPDIPTPDFNLMMEEIDSIEEFGP